MERRRWVNPAQPQTLQISVFLFYFRAAFGLLPLFISPGSFRGIYLLLAFLIIAGQVLAGWGIANEFKWAYPLAIVMAVMPFVLAFVRFGNPFAGSDVIGLMFDIALVALLLHPQSRDYQRIWFK